MSTFFSKSIYYVLICTHKPLLGGVRTLRDLDFVRFYDNRRHLIVFYCIGLSLCVSILLLRRDPLPRPRCVVPTKRGGETLVPTGADADSAEAVALAEGRGRFRLSQHVDGSFEDLDLHIR
jgi:hypothetical protein